MFELTVENASSYLAARAGLPAGPWDVRSLGGGVSNTVLMAAAGGLRLVLKQSLGKLRVTEDWFADRTRIHRESGGMLALAPLLEAGSVPRVVFEDPGNFIYAMEAAPAGARDWKSLLLDGVVEDHVAGRAGRILAAQILSTRREASPDSFERDFGDLTSFDQLRLDPYYRFTASRHPGLAQHFERMVEEALTRRWAIVHGDFSPKNLLVAGDGVMVIDWEVIHYGDPSFDAAFLLNHLFLKCVHMPRHAPRLKEAARRFWDCLRPVAEAAPYAFEAATLRHLGLLHLARADGKSPAEYLSPDERQTVRRLARSWILETPATIEDCIGTIPS